MEDKLQSVELELHPVELYSSLDYFPNECIYEICTKLDTGFLHKLSQTQWRMYDISKDLLKKRRKYEENHLLKLLELFPDKDWCYEWLSKNPNITWDYIEKHPEKDWSYYWLASNSITTWDIIESRKNVNWEKYTYSVSRNPNITWKIVKENPNFPWDYNSLSQNPNITWENIQEDPDKWSYCWLSKKSNISLKIIQDNLQRAWSEYMMRKSKNLLTAKHIFNSNSDYDYHISKNCNTTINDYLKNQDKNWNFEGLSINPNITMDIVNLYPNIPWNYSKLSRNCNITMDIVKANPQINWDYYELSRNCNITHQDIIDNPEIPWTFNFGLSQNKFNKSQWFKYKK